MTIKTQPSDVFADAVPGITFTEDDETWTIESGILVSSAKSNGVFSPVLSGSTLINLGTVLSAAEGVAGVELNGANSSVANAADARIIGADNGVFVDGNTSSIDNHGSIEGLAGIGVILGFGSDHVTVANSGLIQGKVVGILAFSDVDGGTIRNVGRIVSDRAGIAVQAGDGTTTVIDNAAGGRIRGGSDSVLVDKGRIALTNHGILIGDVETVFSGTAADFIANHGKILGEVLLGGGSDVFDGTGGTVGSVDGEDGADRLSGGSAPDQFFGGRGNDRLAGAAGNDRLDGEFGFDTLIGGAGADQFIFTAGLDAARNVDRIADFMANVDRIVLDDHLFAGVGASGLLAAARFHVGAAAADAGDRIIYNPNSGFLFYDRDGRGGAAEIHFATVAPHLALHHTDFLVVHLLSA